MHKYRTLYCAGARLTCLREVLADLRPNAKARAEFNRFFPGQKELLEKVPVMPKWRKAHVLSEANIQISVGKLTNIENIQVRQMLEEEFTDLLTEHNIEHLNISEIRIKNRVITREISQALYSRWGCAGIEFKSNLDNLICYALFEGRAHLRPTGKQISMAIDNEPLVQVCKEFDLELRPMPGVLGFLNSREKMTPSNPKK